MNHVFKVVWSKTKHCYVVVSELAGMQGKKGRSEKRSVQRSVMSSGASAKWMRAALAAAVLVGINGYVTTVEAGNNWVKVIDGKVEAENDDSKVGAYSVALNPDSKNPQNILGTAKHSVAIGYEAKATAIQ